MTSSGKIQRQASRHAYLHREFDALHSWSQDSSTHAPASPAPTQAPAVTSQRELAGWLTERIATMRSLAVHEVPPDEAFTALGLDSLEHVALSGELSSRLGCPVEPTLLYKHPSISALVRHLCGADLTPAGAPPLREPITAEAIAVVGIACRFPKADSVQAFWRLLDEGVDAITEIPASRWPTEGFYESGFPVSGKSCSKWGGFVEGIDQFDAHFFGISPREAVGMDPQQRLLLHTAWHALEDAGVRPDALAGSDTGVFIGAMTRDYELLQITQRATLDAYSGTGSQSSILANRLSYLWGARPELDSGNGVLLVPGGAAPGTRQPAVGRMQPGARWRGQRAARARAVRGAVASADAVARWPLPHLRRRGQRLCAQRGLCRAGLEAPQRRAA